MLSSRKKNHKAQLANQGSAIHSAAVTLQMGQGISNGLDEAAKKIKTDVNGQGTFFNNPMQTIVTVCVFLGSVLKIKDTWESMKDLYYAENKNFTKVANVAINLMQTVTIGLSFAALLTGAAYALPILLPVTAGLTAGWGLYRAVKKGIEAYRAHKTKDKEKRNNALMEMGSHLFVATVSAVTLGLSAVFAGIGASLVKAKNLFLDGTKHWNIQEIADALSMTQNAGSIFAEVKPLAYALGALVSLGTAAAFTHNALQNFDNTLSAILNPMRSIRKMSAAISKKGTSFAKFVEKTYGLGLLVAPVILALEISSLAVKAVSRLTQLIVITPIKIMVGIKDKVKSFFATKKQFRVKESRPLAATDPGLHHVFKKIHKQVQRKKVVDEIKVLRETARNTLAQEHASLKQDLAERIEKLSNKTDKKHLAKKYLLQKLTDKMGKNIDCYKKKENLSAIETSAKKQSTLVKQSFFRDKSRTQRLFDRVAAFDEQMVSQKGTFAA